MSYLTIDTNTADEGQLIVALRDMAAEWSKNRGQCHDFNQGVRYRELREALESRFNVKAHIDTVEHHDDFQVIVDRSM